jgi:hypothetical protein
MASFSGPSADDGTGSTTNRWQKDDRGPRNLAKKADD